MTQAYDEVRRALDDARALNELAEEARDEPTRAEAAQAAEGVAAALQGLEFQKMLSGPHDAAGAIVEIKSGAGGVEAMDWAAMLYRMYARYCERKGWEVEPADLVAGEEAGISSASFIARGDHAYGFLKAERGVHRLVRISPFDANARRQTAFASVDVHPRIDDSISIDIPDKDVEVKAIRGSGAGGQKVNKTSSTIQLRHLPTNMVITIQTERSQSRNRDVAFQILRSRLYDMEVKKREAERDRVESAKMDIAFGSQIRNYVLHPYRQVKDVRFGLESGDTDAVLDGKIQPFIEAYLEHLK